MTVKQSTDPQADLEDVEELVDVACNAFEKVAQIATQLGIRTRNNNYSFVGCALCTTAQDLYLSEAHGTILRRLPKLLREVERACTVRNRIAICLTLRCLLCSAFLMPSSAAGACLLSLTVLSTSYTVRKSHTVPRIRSCSLGAQI